MRTKTLTLWWAVLVAFLMSGCALPIFWYADAKEKRALATRGPEHVFVIDPAPKFLTDELAVAKARETLAKEGYKTHQWNVTSMYGERSSKVVRFTKEGRYRLYSVRLHGGTVSCHSFRGTQRDFDSWSSRPKANPSKTLSR